MTTLQKRTANFTVLLSFFVLAGCDDRPIFGNDDGAVRDGATDAHVADLGVGHDGGPDANHADAGDGGPMLTDLGPDTGMMDLGMIDSGSMDLGHDAGMVDAGSMDAGSDSGDAAMLDAGDAGRLGPAPVLLGLTTDLAAPAAYVLLAKTGITNVTGSLITGGHLGVSPAAASTITGFGLVLDISTGQFAISPSVAAPSKVYASDYAVPTPTNLTTAVSAMQTAYTDAAGRPTPDFTNLASGHLAGLTLVPGLYTFGSSVDMASDVTISGGANDTWIFQITGDLDLATAVHITLGGAAQAKNIWWQVAGNVTIHANAHFEGVILCQTGITLQTNATMTGRALSQSLVAIDSNAITAP